MFVDSAKNVCNNIDIFYAEVNTMKELAFDHQLAQSCAHAFHISTGLGCTVSDTDGQIFFEEGVSFTNYPLCEFAGCSRKEYTASHIYGITEAERFGGKYI